MSDTTVRDSSRDFAPSWLRSSNLSPTPSIPFRSTPASSGSKDRSSDDWFDRRASNVPRWSASDIQSTESGFSNNSGRFDFDHDRSRDVRHHSLSSSRSSSSSQNSWNGRPNHNRPSNGHNSNNLSPRESSNGPNGISYSSVTSKSLKPTQTPQGPVLQPWDFPSLSPAKEIPKPVTQPTVWGNPPHLTKIPSSSGSKRPANANSLENGNPSSLLGSHFGRSFFSASIGKDFKDHLNDALNTVSNGPITDQSRTNEFEENQYQTEESHNHPEESTAEPVTEGELQAMVEEDLNMNTWASVDEMKASAVERGIGLSSTGSTGSNESIDSSTNSQLDGAAMMVDDLLNEAISEDEKIQILHAWQEIKERTGYESYYERVAVNEGHRKRPFPKVFQEGKVETEDDVDDPDDRFIK